MPFEVVAEAEAAAAAAWLCQRPPPAAAEAARPHRRQSLGADAARPPRPPSYRKGSTSIPRRCTGRLAFTIARSDWRLSDAMALEQGAHPFDFSFVLPFACWRLGTESTKKPLY